MQPAIVPSWVTLAEAAHQLGLSEDTVRRKMKRGELPSRRVAMPQGFRYEVQLSNLADPRDLADDLQPGATSETYVGARSATTAAASQPPTQDLSAFLQLLTRQQDQIGDLVTEIAKLQDERAELFGRLGFFQSQTQQLQERLQQSQALLQQSEEELRLLKAPPPAAEPEPAEPIEVEADPEPTPAPEQPRPWWHRLLFG